MDKTQILKILRDKADELYQMDADRVFLVYDMIQDFIKEAEEMDELYFTDEEVQELMDGIQRVLDKLEDMYLPHYKEY